MREYLNAKEVSYNAIFYSAFKALIILELLLESPKTLEQLQSIIEELPYIKTKISQDSLRLYIRTFEKAGCQIVRQLTKEKRRQYSFFIPENPFHPVINKKQTKRFFDIYDMLVYNLPFDKILELELFVKNINTKLKNEYFSKKYEAHSIFKNLNIPLLKELENCCQNNEVVTVLYNSPRSKEKEISILAKKMIIQNYKIYLQGFGLEYKEDAIFLADRIIKITNIEDASSIDIPEYNITNITFELYDNSVELLDNETLLTASSNKRIIKHATTNKVLANHRFLELADKCKILEPTDFKEDFIKTIKSSILEYAYA